MIVPSFDPDEMVRVHDFGPPMGFFSGGPGCLGEAPKEALVNPRAVGFVRDELYIPIYWAED